MHDLDAFYLKKTEPNRSCLLALRQRILKQDDLVTETRKYGMPCFLFKKKMFCYLWVDTKSERPYILFVEGKYLNHKDLEAGSRARMKVLYIHPEQDLPIDTIDLLLQKSLDLYRNGTIKIK